MEKRKQIFKVRYNTDSSITVLDRRNSKVENFLSGSAFISGTTGYNENTDKYPDYVHYYVHYLCEVNRNQSDIDDIVHDMGVYGYNDQK